MEDIKALLRLNGVPGFAAECTLRANDYGINASFLDKDDGSVFDIAVLPAHETRLAEKLRGRGCMYVVGCKEENPVGTAGTAKSDCFHYIAEDVCDMEEYLSGAVRNFAGKETW